MTGGRPDSSSELDKIHPQQARISRAIVELKELNGWRVSMSIPFQQPKKVRAE
jgi:hypothetical protein